jgi:hypothetical protein
MTEVRPDSDGNAQDMPSWSAAEEQNGQADSPPATADASLVMAARRLLEELFSEPPADRRPPEPEQ